VFLVAKLPPGEGGVHLDRKNQPYSLVIATPDSDDWTIDASHETIEMLVDPAGNRLQTSRAITISGNSVVDTTGQLEYLVEACDPCEANNLAYSINGIALSDFITPNFYDATLTGGTSYSFTGSVTQPRQVLPGGYISFVNPQTDDMEQILFLDSTPQLRNPGSVGDSKSLRSFVDSKTTSLVMTKRKPNKKLAPVLREHRSKIAAAAKKRGESYEYSVRGTAA
jgi:hypothetical protein